MKKLAHILIGWGKTFGLISVSIAEKKLSDLRLRSCVKCPEAKPKKILTLLHGVVNYEDSLVCTKCSCPCKEKTIVIDEKCPLDKW